MRPRLALVAALVAGAALVGGRAAFADRLALWEIVHGQCVPAAQQGAPLPPPCLQVDAGDAVIKDRNGVAQLLAIPTQRITGIEDPALLGPDAPDIFAAAWRARGLMRQFLPTAPQDQGLALTVNSAPDRSQDQLHVHVDCLSPDVAKALAAYAPPPGADWALMREPLNGRTYFARAAPDLPVNPFGLLAELPGASAQMGEWTLAAVPIGGRFLLLAGRHGGPGGGHSEDIQDHTCAIAG